MTCRRVRALLSDYVDERMPLVRMQKLRSHLSACPDCRGEWQELVALKHVLKTVKAPQAPEGFWDLALRRVREQRLDPRRHRMMRRMGLWNLLWRRAPALAAGIAAVSLAVLVPLSATLDARDAPAIDTHAALTHHAAYSARLPLTDRGPLNSVLASARLASLD
jgi:anti-sigma factor RsiW